MVWRVLVSICVPGWGYNHSIYYFVADCKGVTLAASLVRGENFAVVRSVGVAIAASLVRGENPFRNAIRFPVT